VEIKALPPLTVFGWKSSGFLEKDTDRQNKQKYYTLLSKVQAEIREKTGLNWEKIKDVFDAAVKAVNELDKSDVYGLIGNLIADFLGQQAKLLASATEKSAIAARNRLINYTFTPSVALDNVLSANKKLSPDWRQSLREALALTEEVSPAEWEWFRKQMNGLPSPAVFCDTRHEQGYYASLLEKLQAELAENFGGGFDI